MSESGGFKLVGGLIRSDLSTFSWPLVEFDGDPARLRFALRLGLGRFAGPWSIPRESVTAVRETRGWFFPGVAIWHAEGERWVFSSPSTEPRQIIDWLMRLGYPIESPER